MGNGFSDWLQQISIHALREEGDHLHACAMLWKRTFLSTPSARRATRRNNAKSAIHLISIHALREEGDAHSKAVDTRQVISIHALREEGDFLKSLSQGALTTISIHALREEGDEYTITSKTA